MPSPRGARRFSGQMPSLRTGGKAEKPAADAAEKGKSGKKRWQEAAGSVANGADEAAPGGKLKAAAAALKAKKPAAPKKPPSAKARNGAARMLRDAAKKDDETVALGLVAYGATLTGAPAREAMEWAARHGNVALSAALLDRLFPVFVSSSRTIQTTRGWSWWQRQQRRRRFITCRYRSC